MATTTPRLPACSGQAGQVVDGDRTYDEQTVHWLAQYLGWPTIVLAVVGYFLLVRRSIRRRSLRRCP